MHDLLASMKHCATLCTTSANIIILGDFSIHVDIPSCQFLQLLNCLNLQQHVDVPKHSGHTLDLVISDSVPINNFLVYDLGVSDHSTISMELPLPFSHTKDKCQICFRDLKNINLDPRSPASLLC